MGGRGSSSMAAHSRNKSGGKAVDEITSDFTSGLTKSQIKELERVKSQVDSGFQNKVEPSQSASGMDVVIDSDGTMWISKQFYDSNTGETISQPFAGVTRRGGDAGYSRDIPEGKKASVRKGSSDAKKTAASNSAKYKAEKAQAQNNLKKTRDAYRAADVASSNAALKYANKGKYPVGEMATISRGDANAIYKAQKSGKLNISSKDAGKVYGWVSDTGPSMRDVSGSPENKRTAFLLSSAASAIRSGNYKDAETILKGFTTKENYEEAKDRVKKYR